AQHPMALVAKVVFAEAPRLREVRPDAPAALERLLLQLLSKDPAGRPLNGAAAAAALAALKADVSAEGTAAASPALTRGERETISVILIGAGGDSAAGGARMLERNAEETLAQPEADMDHA